MRALAVLLLLAAGPIASPALAGCESEYARCRRRCHKPSDKHYAYCVDNSCRDVARESCSGSRCCYSCRVDPGSLLCVCTTRTRGCKPRKSVDTASVCALMAGHDERCWEACERGRKTCRRRPAAKPRPSSRKPRSPVRRVAPRSSSGRPGVSPKAGTAEVCVVEHGECLKDCGEVHAACMASKGPVDLEYPCIGRKRVPGRNACMKAKSACSLCCREKRFKECAASVSKPPRRGRPDK